TGRKSSGIGLHGHGPHDLFVAHARHRIGFLVYIDAHVNNPATIGDALVCHGEFLIKALLVRGLERIFSFFPSLSAIPRELIQHSDFWIIRVPDDIVSGHSDIFNARSTLMAMALLQ